jgi:hypothetical protein
VVTLSLIGPRFFQFVFSTKESACEQNRKRQGDAAELLKRVSFDFFACLTASLIQVTVRLINIETMNKQRQIYPGSEL